jgi:hypothetical protein
MKLAVSTLLLFGSVASAQEALPPPGAESGRLDNAEPRDTAQRKVGRAVLAVPKAVVHVVLAPIRLVLWTNERYELEARARELFYTESENFSVIPTLTYESGIGIRVGGQMDWRITDTDHLRAFAGTGLVGRRFSLSYFTKWEDRVTAQGSGEYEYRPEDRFWGVGNNDTTTTLPAMPALPDETAVETKYRHRLARLNGSVDTRLWSDLHMGVAGALADRRLDPSDKGPPIDMVYDPMALIGFDEYQSVYGELALSWDTRKVGSTWDLDTVTSAGSLVSVWGGPNWVTEGQDFWRFGTDLQHYFRFGEGPRVLSVRFHGEAVSVGDEETPFTELPTLGGAKLLRGYDLERFRDKIAGVGTLEYQWDLSRSLYASTFVDSGRVWSTWDQLTLDGLRTGFGMALELHTPTLHLLRGSIATSVDGGVQFNFYLEPVFAVIPRVERR